MNDQQSNSTPASSGGNNLVIPITVAALLVFAIIGFYIYQSNSSKQPASTQVTETTPSAEAVATPTSETAAFKDGTYSADGNYVSPGGPRDIGLTVTITDGKITEATFEGRATDPTSKRFQGEFADNFKPMVLGKNIDEVALTKVSGSSLTPKGFQDALEKIKTEAKG